MMCTYHKSGAFMMWGRPWRPPAVQEAGCGDLELSSQAACCHWGLGCLRARCNSRCFSPVPGVVGGESVQLHSRRSHPEQSHVIMLRRATNSSFPFICLRDCVGEFVSQSFLCLFADVSRAREYCESEAFRARCRSNEVILMQSALYGRMRLGKWTLNQHHYR